MRSNIVGAYHVFEAARIAGVTRVIFASSGATVSGWEREPPLSALVAGRYDEAGTIRPLTHETPLRPSGLYGASKVWGEALARHYADAHGLSVICLRIDLANSVSLASRMPLSQPSPLKGRGLFTARTPALPPP